MSLSWTKQTTLPRAALRGQGYGRLHAPALQTQQGLCTVSMRWFSFILPMGRMICLLLHTPGWPWMCGLLAPASRVLRLQACAIPPGRDGYCHYCYWWCRGAQKTENFEVCPWYLFFFFNLFSPMFLYLPLLNSAQIGEGSFRIWKSSSWRYLEKAARRNRWFFFNSLDALDFDKNVCVGGCLPPFLFLFLSQHTLASFLLLLFSFCVQKDLTLAFQFAWQPDILQHHLVLHSSHQSMEVCSIVFWGKQGVPFHFSACRWLEFSARMLQKNLYPSS